MVSSASLPAREVDEVPLDAVERSLRHVRSLDVQRHRPGSATRQPGAADDVIPMTTRPLMTGEVERKDTT
jgi:hypothetical protein